MKRALRTPGSPIGSGKARRSPNSGCRCRIARTIVDVPHQRSRESQHAGDPERRLAGRRPIAAVKDDTSREKRKRKANKRFKRMGAWGARVIATGATVPD